MKKEEIEQAAQQYAHNHFNMHETNNYKALVQGFEAGARLKLLQLQQLQSENERVKAERECKQVTADYLYKDWLKATKRTGSVLLGSSVRDFIQYLDSHFKITTTT